MTEQRNLPIGAAYAAQPGCLSAAPLSGVSGIATRLVPFAKTTGGRRGGSLPHPRTGAAGQNETLVSQYPGGFPSRDIGNVPSNERQAGVMTGMFGSGDAGRWEPLR